MDWAPLIKGYNGPLSIGWALDDGEVVIRVRVPPDATIDLPASIRVVVSSDLEIPQALAMADAKDNDPLRGHQRWYRMDELDELMNRIMRICMIYLKPGDADKLVSMGQEIRDYRRQEYEWQAKQDEEKGN